ncbi:MAG: hypothetical protein CVU97_01100 [Firmicutes bacterium HGW-Firmicutes-21]|nr:MAG: hypothetical protein CVU97_01100 [Firmicutes bacterium HGW-Firmicutes-21]
MKNNDFGKYLSEHRANKKIKQSDLAKLMGVPKRVVAKWENGTKKPSIINIYKLCDLLDVDFEDAYNVLIDNKASDEFRFKKAFYIDYLIKKRCLIYFLSVSVLILVSLLYYLNNPLPSADKLWVLSSAFVRSIAAAVLIPIFYKLIHKNILYLKMSYYIVLFATILSILIFIMLLQFALSVGEYVPYNLHMCITAICAGLWSFNKYSYSK